MSSFFRESPRSLVGNVLLIVAVSAGVFANSLSNEFVWDDTAVIGENLLIRDVRNLPRIFATDYWDLGVPRPDVAGNYRPLTVATFLLSYLLTGPDPSGFRVVNVALHGLNGAGVYLLALALGLTSGRARAAGLLFALHPVHVEAVVWITGRAELLACLFLLGSLLLFLAHERSGSRWALAGSLASFVLSLLSKESGLTLVAILAAALLLGTAGPGPARVAPAVRRLAPYLAVAGLYLALRLAVLGTLSQSAAGAGSFLHGRSGVEIFLIVIQALAYAWRLLLFPVHLSAHYDSNDFPVPATWTEPAFVLAVLVHVASFGAVVLAYRRGKGVLALAVAWVPLTLLPYSQIVRFQWLLAERFLYIPSVGFAVALAVAGAGLVSRLQADATRRRAVAASLLGVVLALYGAKTVDRNRTWRDEVVFFGTLAREKPWVAGLRMKHGDALLHAGRTEEALAEYEAAWRLWPDMPGILERLRTARQRRRVPDRPQ